MKFFFLSFKLIFKLIDLRLQLFFFIGWSFEKKLLQSGYFTLHVAQQLVHLEQVGLQLKLLLLEVANVSMSELTLLFQLVNLFVELVYLGADLINSLSNCFDCHFKHIFVRLSLILHSLLIILLSLKFNPFFFQISNLGLQLIFQFGQLFYFISKMHYFLFQQSNTSSCYFFLFLQLQYLLGQCSFSHQSCKSNFIINKEQIMVFKLRHAVVWSLKIKTRILIYIQQLMSEREQEVEALIDKMMKNHLNVRQIWIEVDSELDQFLKRFEKQISFNYLIQESLLKITMENLLDSSRGQQAIYKQCLNTNKKIIINKLKKIQQKIHGPVVQPKINIQHQIEQQEEQGQIEAISDSQLHVQIYYNVKRLEWNYQCNRISLQNQINNFIEYSLYKEVFYVNSKAQKLRIFQFKEELKDQYTNTYTFDPFFNSLKFQLLRKDKALFKNNFKVIKSSGRVKSKFNPNQDQKFWKDQTIFQLSDSTNLLIDYICQKQGASNDVKSQLRKIFQFHGMKTIKNLLANTKQFVKEIQKKKWANQVFSEIQKLKSKQVKPFTGNQKLDDKKKSCFRVGNSHKILRFLYYKNKNQIGQGIQNLKKVLPYINPQNMLNTFKIMQDQLVMDTTFRKLQKYFLAFTLLPKENEQRKLQTPYGMLFYGPPGTGKTKLTEDLANLMGFHLITNGLSSADFMKQLVGQSKGMIQSLLMRPSLSKHLICSMAIDEIDPIVADRRDKQSKHGQGTAMFLSSLGGNQAVQNILVLGSTNYIKKIDDAILRRFDPNVYIGVPNKEGRSKILKYYLINHQQKQNYISFLVSITPNFSGAALKSICQQINNRYSAESSLKLSVRGLTSISKQVGRSFKITFGDQTFPEIVERSSALFSKQLFQSNNLIVVSKQQLSLYQITYEAVSQKWQNGKIGKKISLKSINFRLPLKNQFIQKDGFIELTNWLSENLRLATIVKCNYAEFFNLIINNKQYREPHILVVNMRPQDFEEFQKIKDLGCKKNLQIILYNLSNKSILNHKAFKFQVNFDEENYSRKILIDISRKSKCCMQLEVKLKNNKEVYLESIPFFQEEEVKYSKDILPSVIDYFITKNADYIQLINNQFLFDHNSYKEEDIISIISQKFKELKNYSKAAIIIFLDDLVSIIRSFSNSSSGINESTSLSSTKIFKIIMDLAKNIKSTKNSQDNETLWVAIIIQDGQLSKLVRKQLNWPENIDQRCAEYEKQLKQNQEKQMKMFVTCNYCGQRYTGEQNQKEKKCKRHYGDFIDEKTFKMEDFTLDKTRFLSYIHSLEERKSKVKYEFLYSCCWQPLSAEGCEVFHHFGGNTCDEVSESEKMRKDKYPKWQQQCESAQKLSKIG